MRTSTQGPRRGRVSLLVGRVSLLVGLGAAALAVAGWLPARLGLPPPAHGLSTTAAAQSASRAPTVSVAELARQVDAARLSLHRGEGELEPLLDRMRRLADDLGAAAEQATGSGKKAEAAEAWYWRAVALLELASITEGIHGLSAQAYELFEQAQRAATRAAELAPSHSDARRVLGEAMMRVIAYQPANAPFLGTKAYQEVDRALRLDPRNALAYIAMAAYYWGAPAEFVPGGPRRGLLYIDQALRVADTDLARYLAYVWQGNLYRKLGDEPRAQEAFRQALAIFPRGGMALAFQRMNQGAAR